MKANLKGVKETKARLNIKEDEPKEIIEPVISDPLERPSLKDQVNKFTKRLENMIQKQQKEEIERKKDENLIKKIK